MQKRHNDENLQCPECNMVGMTYRTVFLHKAIFANGAKELPRHSHVCENCGNEFRTEDERIMNLRLRLIFRSYYFKYEEL